MKNSKKIIAISIFAAMACSMFFTACGNEAGSNASDTAEKAESETETETETETTTETTTEVPTEEPTKNPIDALSDDDRDLYEALLELSNGFKNPSSIRLVTKVRDFGTILNYKISGENGFGATVTEWYDYNSDEKTLTPSVFDYDSMNFELYVSDDIPRINKALEYHFQQVGY